MSPAFKSEPRRAYPMASKLLVLAQALCLVFLFTTGSWKAYWVDLLIWQLSGAFLAISGVVGLGIKSFSIFPEPRNTAQLIQNGVFAYIRHPIYAGILMLTAALVWQYWSIERAVVWIFLLLIFVVKIKREEKALLLKFPEYLDYQQNTNRLIPFVW